MVSLQSKIKYQIPLTQVRVESSAQGVEPVMLQEETQVRLELASA